MLKLVLLNTVSGFQLCAKGQSREINYYHVGIKSSKYKVALTVVGVCMPMVLEKNEASSNITVFAEKFP